MVYEGIKGAVLTGEIPIKGFPGDLQIVAKIAHRDVLIIVLEHQLQKTLLQLPLAIGRLL